MIEQGRQRPKGFKTPSKRQIALTLIREDYAKHGEDTGIATRSMLENKISRKAYDIEAHKGLQIRSGKRKW